MHPQGCLQNVWSEENRSGEERQYDNNDHYGDYFFVHLIFSFITRPDRFRSFTHRTALRAAGASVVSGALRKNLSGLLLFIRQQLADARL